MSTVIVTGAGSGIGRATAVKLASEGHRVVLMGRNIESLKETASNMNSNGNEHQIAVADVRNPSSVKEALDKCRSALSNLSAVVANAGVGGPNTYGSDDRWSEIVETNLGGSYYIVNESLPYLKDSKEKSKNIIFIASILARLGVPGYSAYCASKAGVLGLMRSLATELASERILVNAICPGWVDTAMARQGIEGFAKFSGLTYEDAYREQMKPVPLGKMSDPKEIASLVNFLISSQQSSITGQAIDINNGALMP